MTSSGIPVPVGHAPRENLLYAAFALLRQHRRAFWITYIIYFATILIGMIVVAFNRPLQDALYDAVGVAFGEGGMFGPVTEAYSSGAILKSVGLTFIVNLVIGTFLSITLPSLIVPFSGWLVGIYRAVLWGFLFMPTFPLEFTPQNILSAVLIVGLLFLEGEGYVLGMFAAYLQGRSFLFHRTEGVETPRQGYLLRLKHYARIYWQGYLLGLKQSALIYILVVGVLLIAALYEVLIYMITVSLT